jgi:hypothetical protein
MSLGGRARPKVHFMQQLLGSFARCRLLVLLGARLKPAQLACSLVRLVLLVATRLLVSRCALVCSQWSRLVLSRVCVASARAAFLVHSRSRHPFTRIGLTFTRPPQRRVGRRSLVISSTGPVQSRWSALVARTASVCLCLPRGQNGTSCRPVALVAARKLVTSPQPRACSSLVRLLLVSRSRDLLSSVGGLVLRLLVTGPIRSLRGPSPASRAFCIRSPRAH